MGKYFMVLSQSSGWEEKALTDHSAILVPRSSSRFTLFDLRAETLRSCFADIWHSVALTGLALMASQTWLQLSPFCLLLSGFPGPLHSTLLATLHCVLWVDLRRTDPSRGPSSLSWALNPPQSASHWIAHLQNLVRFCLQRYPKEFCQELR